VLRGSSFFTPPRLRDARFRNFYTPDRRDMLCGFRTCAP
jgi:formylglycine-generating enzyme required for sulfatase activity